MWNGFCNHIVGGDNPSGDSNDFMQLPTLPGGSPFSVYPLEIYFKAASHKFIIQA